MAAAKEEMLSGFGPWCADLPLAASFELGENSRLGFARKNAALHLGQAVCNSTTALGIERGLLRNCIGSRIQTWNRYAYVLNNPLSYRDPLGLWCVWEDGSHDDDEGDGGASSTDCANQGGHWDQFDNITGIFQDGNGNVTQINSVWGTSNLGANSGFTLSDFDTSLASYQDTTVTVGQFSNTMFNPFNHVALQIGNGAFYGQAPRSTLAFLRHFAFGSPNTPGVPGTIEVQNPSAMTNGITFPVSGAQAGMIQSEINQSLQNPPPYDVYGPSPTCDCAFWIQNVLGGAGINSGAPTIYPSQLLWQLQQAIP